MFFDIKWIYTFEAVVERSTNILLFIMDNLSVPLDRQWRTFSNWVRVDITPNLSYPVKQVIMIQYIYISHIYYLLRTRDTTTISEQFSQSATQHLGLNIVCICEDLCYLFVISVLLPLDQVSIQQYKDHDRKMFAPRLASILFRKVLITVTEFQRKNNNKMRIILVMKTQAIGLMNRL